MTTLKSEMDRVFDRFFEPKWEEYAAVGGWAPSLDLSETKEAFMVKAEVPGMTNVVPCCRPSTRISSESRSGKSDQTIADSYPPFRILPKLGSRTLPSATEVSIALTPHTR